MINRPLSEQLHEAWLDWSDKKQAADMLTEMKSAFLNQKIRALGDMPYNAAEREVKASEEWSDYISKMVDATTAANRALGRREYIRAKITEWQNAEANHRAQARQ